MSSEMADGHMSTVKLRVNAIRWLLILIGSVALLVIFLLSRHSGTSSDLGDHFIELNEAAAFKRWSIPRAQSWYAKEPWLLGANYLPSYAVNVLEMWQEETFDKVVIERELVWANKRLRMNALRRLDEFLTIAEKNNLKIMLVLFDECWLPEPHLGKQPEPIPGVHNSQWVRCPGQSMVINQSSWPILKDYTVAVINRYKSDKRIFAWDIYNEPECSKQIDVILPLLHFIHMAARSVADVEQPMTMGIAKWPLTTPLAIFELAMSDVISFHSYGPLANVRENVTDLRKAQPGRPILCTEWLARPFGSTLFTHLDYFRTEKIGAIQWGLVAGRSQTYYQWKSPKNAPMPRVWFHDVLYQNGTPFSHLEEQLYAEIGP